MEIIIIELKGDNRKVSVKIRKLEGTITFRGSPREETDKKRSMCILIIRHMRGVDVTSAREVHVCHAHV